MTLKRMRIFFQIVIYLFYISVYGSVDVSDITLIGGTGPVGAPFLYHLSSCDKLNISVIGRKNSVHFDAIKKDGLHIENMTKKRKIEISKLYDSCSEIEDASQDFVLVALKQPCFTEEMACHIKRIVKPSGLIAFAWNGIPFYFIESNAKEKKLAEIFKDCKLLHINPFIAGEKTTPGCVKINTEMDSFFIQFSKVQNISDEEVLGFVEFLKKVNIPLMRNQLNFKELIFEKLKYSLAISTLSALEERPLDVIFHGEKYESFIRYCIETINKIGEQLGLTRLKSYDDFKRHPLIQSHYSSLYHDIKNNLPNEIYGIVGKTLYLAMKINIEFDLKIDLSPLALLNFQLSQMSSFNFVLPLNLTSDLFPKTNSPLLAKISRGFCP
ncbi:MAG: hypothetical protein NEHIOOID_00177 [Holosporales bacterium]